VTEKTTFSPTGNNAAAFSLVVDGVLVTIGGRVLGVSQIIFDKKSDDDHNRQQIT
jgi:hypothetical protein